ncbi:hypothetical protein VPNG_07601 [Cytospora leucostoma]|uniref:Uncharacterized protein n=1 Tax=Cytospora leucostoma TaxID=1230097 RepID=A0A423WDE6_9PEZI|nr:hypothetical protein VPNG_07601 [Cytospora leucostoma]
MANGTFFISWQLWEEMTFVLASAIVVVFLVGLVKLWWTNRHMRKIEQLDAEKQARMVQVRKSGLPAQASVNVGRFGGEIPFGIKAIEAGAEVEGIWIARMASMASRPPDRKWSSKRKVKTPVASALLEMNDLGSSPSKRARRGSSRASRISRREIMGGSSSQTKGKLERLSLLEEERTSKDMPLREGSSEQYAIDGQSTNLAAQGATPQPGHKGPLGRIQRSLKKKVTSAGTHDAHPRNSRMSGEGVREFREQVAARKPQRFYPKKSTTPLVEPSSKNQVARPQVNSLPSEYESGQVPGQAGDRSGQYPLGQSVSAPRGHEIPRRTSSNSTSSSLQTFVTTSELPRHFVPAWRPPPLEDHPALADGDGMNPQAQRYDTRRSLRSTQHPTHRLSSADSSSLHDDANDTAQSTPQMATTAHRYPPNSSRSASVAYSRSQPVTQHQQQQQSASSSTQHSPALGPSDSYANVTKRRVNSNFEVLPAGTFGGFPEQAYDPLPTREPSSAADSVRSSFDSQGTLGSGGKRKSRNKLRKKSISSQYRPTIGFAVGVVLAVVCWPLSLFCGCWATETGKK